MTTRPGRLVAVLALLVLLAAIVAGCGGSSNDSPPPAPPPPTAPPATPPATAPPTAPPATAPVTPPTTPPTSMVPDNGDFILQIDEPQDPANAEIAQSLVASGIFQQMLEQLNGELALPYDITVVLGENGDGGPFYDPNNRTIQIQYQFDRLVQDLLARAGTPPESLELRTRQAGLFIFYHEMGHALIDAYELPVTGREEDAVDQLASVVSIAVLENPEIALAGADVFAGLATTREGQSMLSLYADEHTLDQVRVLNIACLVYGSNPTAYEQFAIDVGLTADEDRPARCPGEYEQARTSWSKLLSPFFLNTGAPTTPTAPPSVPTAPTTPPVAPGTDFPNAQEAALLGVIPEATRTACGRSTDADKAAAALASVTCDLTSTVGNIAYYESFPDLDSMNAYYQDWVGRSGLAADTAGECSTGSPAEQGWGNGIGRVVCYVDSNNTAWVVWTYDQIGVASTASRADGDLTALFQWWSSPDSGPTA